MKIRHKVIKTIPEKDSVFFNEMNAVADNVDTHYWSSSFTKDRNVGYPGEVFDRFNEICQTTSEAQSLLVWAFEYKKEDQRQQHEVEQQRNFFNRIEAYLKERNSWNLFYEILVRSFKDGNVSLKNEEIEEFLKTQEGRARLAYLMVCQKYSDIVVVPTFINVAVSMIKNQWGNITNTWDVTKEVYFIFEVSSLLYAEKSLAKNKFLKPFKTIRFSEMKEEQETDKEPDKENDFEAMQKFFNASPFNIRLVNIMLSVDQIGSEFSKKGMVYFEDLSKYKITKNARVRMSYSLFEHAIKEKCGIPRGHVTHWVETSCNIFRKEWKAALFYEEMFKRFLQTEIKKNLELLQFFFDVKAKFPKFDETYMHLISDDESYNKFDDISKLKMLEDIVGRVSTIENYEKIYEKHKALSGSKEKVIDPDISSDFEEARYRTGKVVWDECTNITMTLRDFVQKKFITWDYDKETSFIKKPNNQERVSNFIKRYHKNGSLEGSNGEYFLDIINSFVSMEYMDRIDYNVLKRKIKYGIKDEYDEDDHSERKDVQTPKAGWDDLPHSALYLEDADITEIWLDVHMKKKTAVFMEHLFSTKIHPDDRSAEAKELAMFFVHLRYSGSEEFEKIFISKEVLARRELLVKRKKVIVALKEKLKSNERCHAKYAVPSWCYDDFVMIKVIVYFLERNLFIDAADVLPQIFKRVPFVQDSVLGKYYREVVLKNA